MVDNLMSLFQSVKDSFGGDESPGAEKERVDSA